MRASALLIPLAAILGTSSAALASPQATVRVDVAANGVQANDGGASSVLSADGRWVAFQSIADNLVPGDSNNVVDVFVHDRHTGDTERISVDHNGLGGDYYSYVTAMTADARYVAYFSGASNLVPNDTNFTWDVFVRDRDTDTTERVSVDSLGVESNGASWAASISDDGRFVAFYSMGSNLWPGDSNQNFDVFVRDTLLDQTTCASVTPQGTVGNGMSLICSISGDGRWVAFESEATDLTADAVTSQDVFLRDLVNDVTTLVSWSAPGVGGDHGSAEPSISYDGRWIAFKSRAADLLVPDTNDDNDIFVRDVQTGAIVKASTNNLGGEVQGGSFYPTISRDGRFVVFTSPSPSLVQGDTNQSYDVFLRDLLNLTTERLSVASGGQEVTGNSGNAAWSSISADGRFVAFESEASQLIGGDQNNAMDVFVRDRTSPNVPITTYCTPKTNSQGYQHRITTSGLPSLSGDDAFFITSWFALPNKPATFFWGPGAAAAPFGGGTLCVQPPFIRSGVLYPYPGTKFGPVAGAYSFLFSQAHMAAHGLTAGIAVFGQFWSRDPGFAAPNNIGLSDAILFNIAP